MSKQERAPEPTGDTSWALELLGRGEIDVDEYLELRLAEHIRRFRLDDRLSPAELEALRQVLRAHYRTDPALDHYLARALDGARVKSHE